MHREINIKDMLRIYMSSNTRTPMHTTDRERETEGGREGECTCTPKLMHAHAFTSRIENLENRERERENQIITITTAKYTQIDNQTNKQVNIRPEI